MIGQVLIYKGDERMKKSDKVEWIAQIVFYALGLIILIKMVVTIIKPVSMVVDTKYNKGFYENILSKSTASFEVIGNSYEDDEKSDLFPMVFKYITGIDIGSPKTYIASQIPLLGLFDITAIASNEDGPVVVIPREGIDSENPPSSGKNTENNGQTVGEKGNNSSETPSQVGEKGNNSSGKTPQVGEKVVTPGNIQNPSKRKLNASKPLVLIYHTHATEAYNPNNVRGGNSSEKLENGVVVAGEMLKKELESKYGIATIHDITIHDLPVREKGYARAKPTVKKYINKYPGLKIIIDLHRDDAKYPNQTTAIINNKRYARVMFVFGGKNKNLAKSKAFTANLNNYFDKYYPKLSRGFFYHNNSVFNQDLTDKLVILELGSIENSLDEALNTNEIIAKIIALSIK